MANKMTPLSNPPERPALFFYSVLSQCVSKYIQGGLNGGLSSKLQKFPYSDAVCRQDLICLLAWKYSDCFHVERKKKVGSKAYFHTSTVNIKFE